MRTKIEPFWLHQWKISAVMNIQWMMNEPLPINVRAQGGLCAF